MGVGFTVTRKLDIMRLFFTLRLARDLQCDYFIFGIRNLIEKIYTCIYIYIYINKFHFKGNTVLSIFVE